MVLGLGFAGFCFREPLIADLTSCRLLKVDSGAWGFGVGMAGVKASRGLLGFRVLGLRVLGFRVKGF